ncbi:MAG: hypothetical protein M3426_15910 [Actinomycetota bacterium]|nr:hypothetical protein [Actinomycetota bacterium]
MNKLEQLRQRKADYERELERIRGDRDYNDGARARRIAPIYGRLKAEERRVLDEMKAETAETAASKGRKAFEAPAMYGADKALVAMNYRHALDSVEGLLNSKDMDARLERAVLTGDAALARAVAYRANETGDTGTVTKYLDSDEDSRRAYEEWASAHEDLQQLVSYGAELAFGYAEVDEPREMRLPEAREALSGSWGDAA